jgi:phosphoribosylformylglycinamidine cyclo-ligase
VSKGKKGAKGPAWTYDRAGVDLHAAGQAVRLLAPLAAATRRPGVIGGIGGFGGLFRFPARRFRSPVLVAATDGVGTKLKVAFALDRHDTIGIDLVAMSVNDILVQGGEPLFFLDYLACGTMRPRQVAAVVAGIAEGCRMARCALLGGETAEMPGFYRPGEYDLAGFAVGAVEERKVLDGSRIRPGDVLVGLPSSGLHSNGYSLARAIVTERGRKPWDRRPEGWDRTLGEALLEPTRIYVRPLLDLLKNCRVKGLVHITGGGWRENLVRVLPPGCKAEVRRGSWEVPEIFPYLQKEGRVARAEMYRTFNMGVGMIVFAAPKEAGKITERLRARREKHFVIGRVVEGRRGVRFL